MMSLKVVQAECYGCGGRGGEVGIFKYQCHVDDQWTVQFKYWTSIISC